MIPGQGGGGTEWPRRGAASRCYSPDQRKSAGSKRRGSHHHSLQSVGTKLSHRLLDCLPPLIGTVASGSPLRHRGSGGWREPDSNRRSLSYDQYPNGLKAAASSSQRTLPRRETDSNFWSRSCERVRRRAVEHRPCRPATKSRATERRCRASPPYSGTGGSNPSPSSGESSANLALGYVVGPRRAPAPC
jgi:hypothetical protein